MEHTLGSRLREARKRAGLTASSLAHAAGVTEDAIRKVESGNSKQPSFTTGVRIANALGVAPLMLATGEQPSHEPDILARVIWVLRSRREELEAHGVRHAAVFGSVARGQCGVESDVDVLIEVDPDVSFSLLARARIAVTLKDDIGRRVDVMLERSARGSRYEDILREAIYAF